MSKIEGKKIIIDGRLPDLNTSLSAAAKHRLGWNRLKQATQNDLKWAIIPQLKGVNFNKSVFIEYHWYERDKRRDKSNIAFAKKFIEDVLIDLNIIVNDNWEYMQGFSDYFYVDKKNPRIEIIIKRGGII